MITQQRIFLLEDDINFGSVMKSYLEMNNFITDWINDGKNAVSKYIKHRYDLCILDVMLPHIDGFTIASEIKKITPDTPIVFLTAKTLKDDMIKGFNLGADDYITKPFDSEVLIYKIKAILNRNKTSIDNKNEIITIGKYSFDYKTRNLSLNNKNIHKLSPKESDLLFFLAKNKNKVLDRTFALEKIWGTQGYFTARSMDVYITKLRKYLKEDNNIQITNIHGSGYILKINS